MSMFKHFVCYYVCCTIYTLFNLNLEIYCFVATANNELHLLFVGVAVVVVNIRWMRISRSANGEIYNK